MPGDAGVEQLDQVVFQSGQINLGFRVAEPGIEFQHLWPGLGEHQTGVEDAAEVDAFGGTTAEPGIEDLAIRLGQAGRAQKRGGAIGAHAAGVEPAVAVERALVVLGGGEEAGGRAIAQGVEGDLHAFQEFLDDDARAGGAEGLPDEDLVDGSFGLRHVARTSARLCPAPGRRP